VKEALSGGNEEMETPLIHTQLLTNKRAVIFGAGGAVGSAVAREFAAQGATVFLSGRTLDAVEQVAQEIQQDGGIAYAAEVDALDEQAVQAYLDRVAQEGGSIAIHHGTCSRATHGPAALRGHPVCHRRR